MSSTSLKKRTSLGGGGGNAALSSRAPAGGGLVATALGFGGSVPDEVARKVKIDFFLSLCAPMLFSVFSLSLIFNGTNLPNSEKTTGGREARAIATVEEER